jgi:antitoxin component YwqK of YwqJK toxin-antitoxin module
MKNIFFVIFLISFLGFGQSKLELERQISSLLSSYGLIDIDKSSGQYKSCGVSFEDNTIEVNLTHHGDELAVKLIGGSYRNIVVDYASKIDLYRFNISSIKLKQNGSLDYNLLKFGDGETVLFLYVYEGSHQSLSYGTYHIENENNNEVNKYVYFDDNGALIAKYNESWKQILFTVPKRKTTAIMIPLIKEASSNDYFKNTLNRLFVKYLEPERDIVFEYGQNGTTSESHLLNGKKHGYTSYYYENGKPRLVEIWENGKRIAFKDQFLEDGTQILKDGYGMYKEFYKNGKTSFEAVHSEGRRAGKATWYYDNGQIKHSAVYKFTKDDIYGLRWEIVSSFHKDGTPREKGTLKEGNGTWIIYDDYGKLKEVLEFKNGILVK